MGKQVAARLNGGLAQLGEHLPCKQGVESSNLLVSIRKQFLVFEYNKCTLKISHRERYIRRNESFQRISSKQTDRD